MTTETMPQAAAGVHRRASATNWQWRIKAPLDLQPLYPGQWASLATADLREASTRAAALQAVWMEHLDEQRKMLNPQRVEVVTPALGKLLRWNKSPCESWRKKPLQLQPACPASPLNMHNTRSSLLLMLFLAGGCAASQSTPVPMHELTKDKTTELTNGDEFLVIQSSAEFSKALTRKLSHVSAQKPEDVLKAVDFKTETVVSVMLSNRGSSCTGVDITSITQDGKGSVVHYHEHEPAPGDVCLDTVYSPFHFVAIAKTNAPVKFEKDEMP